MKKVLISSLFIGNFCFAYEFHSLGFESIGMGGAGVSNAKGSMAGYYNPALLAKPRYNLEVSTQVGIGVKEDNLAEHVDSLSEIKLNETIDKITGTQAVLVGLNFGLYNEEDKQNIKKAQDILKDVYVQNNLTILPSASFSFQWKNMHLGIYNTATASAHIVIDPDALELYTPYGNGQYVYYDPNATANPYSLVTLSQSEYEKSSLQYALDNGKTHISLEGISLVEIPISYAKSYEVGYGDLSIGGSLKYMGVGVYKDSIQVDTSSDDIVDSFNDKLNTASNYGIDLGLLYQPIEQINLGLVVKNINSPEFETKNSNEKITIDPMIRGGLTLSFWDSVDFSIDYDISENETALSYEKSQYLGGGLNFRPASWLTLRAGLMNNVAYEESPNIYTAGVGFGLKWFQLDLSAQMAELKNEVNGNEVSDYVKVNFALVSRWGEGSTKKAPIIQKPQPLISKEKKEEIEKNANEAFKQLDQEI